MTLRSAVEPQTLKGLCDRALRLRPKLRRAFEPVAITQRERVATEFGRFRLPLPKFGLYNQYSRYIHPVSVCYYSNGFNQSCQRRSYMDTP
jgi:hypothetical protein